MFLPSLQDGGNSLGLLSSMPYSLIFDACTCINQLFWAYGCCRSQRTIVVSSEYTQIYGCCRHWTKKIVKYAWYCCECEYNLAVTGLFPTEYIVNDNCKTFGISLSHFLDDGSTIGIDWAVWVLLECIMHSCILCPTPHWYPLLVQQ